MWEAVVVDVAVVSPKNAFLASEILVLGEVGDSTEIQIQQIKVSSSGIKKERDVCNESMVH